MSCYQEFFCIASKKTYLCPRSLINYNQKTNDKYRKERVDGIPKKNLGIVGILLGAVRYWLWTFGRQFSHHKSKMVVFNKYDILR